MKNVLIVIFCFKCDVYKKNFRKFYFASVNGAKITISSYMLTDNYENIGSAFNLGLFSLSIVAQQVEL